MSNDAELESDRIRQEFVAAKEASLGEVCPTCGRPTGHGDRESEAYVAAKAALAEHRHAERAGRTPAVEPDADASPDAIEASATSN